MVWSPKLDVLCKSDHPLTSYNQLIKQPK